MNDRIFHVGVVSTLGDTDPRDDISVDNLPTGYDCHGDSFLVWGEGDQGDGTLHVVARIPREDTRSPHVLADIWRAPLAAWINESRYRLSDYVVFTDADDYSRDVYVVTQEGATTARDFGGGDIADALNTFDDGMLMMHVGERLSCTEVEALATILRAHGRDEAAIGWIEAHSTGDTDDDEHVELGLLVTARDELRRFGKPTIVTFGDPGDLCGVVLPRDDDHQVVVTIDDRWPDGDIERPYVVSYSATDRTVDPGNDRVATGVSVDELREFVDTLNHPVAGVDVPAPSPSRP